MHYHLSYKSSRPERRKRSKRIIYVFLIIIRRIGEKLESKSGNEHVAHAQQFYWAQKSDI